VPGTIDGILTAGDKDGSPVPFDHDFSYATKVVGRVADLRHRYGMVFKVTFSPDEYFIEYKDGRTVSG